MRTNGRTKVLVAVDPVALRSALGAALASDSRLDIVALPPEGSIEEAATVVDVVLTSETPLSSAVPVVLIHGCGRTVEVNGTTPPQTFPYGGLRWLADLLVTTGCGTDGDTGVDTHFFVTPARRTPESESGAGSR